MDYREANVEAGKGQHNSQDLVISEVRSSSIESCSFPELDENLQSGDERSLVSLELNESGRLYDLCEQHAWSNYQLLQLIWALTLRCYTGNDSVCFGLLDYPHKARENGREINGEDAVCMFLVNLTILASDSFKILVDRFGFGDIRVRYQRQISLSEQSKGSLRKPFDTVVVEKRVESPNCPVNEALTGLNSYQVIDISSLCTSSFPVHLVFIDTAQVMLGLMRQLYHYARALMCTK